MAITDVTQYSTTPASNADVNGTNIAENCAAAGINDAIRGIMSHIAIWIAATTGPLLRVAANTIANAIKILDGSSTARYIGYRSIPLTAQSTSYQIALTDVGQGISTTAGVTVPPNATVAFAVGDTVTIYNNSASSITITQGAGVTLRLVGTSTTGSRSLAQRGLCTVLKVGTDEWVVSGGGLS